jgi:hypothetical protein
MTTTAPSSPPMSEFHLRGLVRDTLATSTSPDPGVIAEAVLAVIPDDQLRSALHQTLRAFVRNVISDVRTAPSHPTRPPVAARSAKGMAAREAWHQRLNDPVHVGDGVWHFLRDCSFDDLMSASRERRELAARNEAWADVYEQWANLLASHKVACFGDLPVAVQETALSRAA